MAEDRLNLWQKLFTRALSIPEGEIDFIVSAALTSHPAIGEEVLGRAVMVETSAEIIAKKIWHRSAEFAARDIFDFALVMQKEPQAVLQGLIDQAGEWARPGKVAANLLKLAQAVHASPRVQEWLKTG